MMVRLLPAARADIVSIVDYLLAQFAYDAAERFTIAVEDAPKFIASNPRAGAPAIRNLRCWTLHDFPKIRVYYAVHATDAVEVVRILHTARDIVAAFDED